MTKEEKLMRINQLKLEIENKQNELNVLNAEIFTEKEVEDILDNLKI